MSKQEINTRLIKQYLSDPSGLGRLYREQQSSQGKGKMEDELPETNERVLALAREAGAEIARRRRRRFYVPVALAASVLVAVVAVQLLKGPATDTPDIQLLGSEPPARQIVRIRELVKHGRRDEAIKALDRLRQKHPDYVIPADLQSLSRQ